MKRIAWILAALFAFALALMVSPAAEGALVLQDNMKELRCAMPDENYRFVGSSAPGQIFLPEEPVDVRLAFKKGGDSGMVDFAIEIQEIGTRTPGRVSQDKKGYTDTAGNAPIVDVIGQPVVHPLKVAFGDQVEQAIEVLNLPVPKRFGTYALILVRADHRQFLGSLCRVPRPREYGTLENTPVLGDGVLLDREPLAPRALAYARMGVRGWRSELSWSEDKDGKYQWEKLDRLFAAAELSGQRIMVTLGSHPDWAKPFGTHIPAANWSSQKQGYSGTGDWLCKPELYERYGKWITAFCQRYWKDGKGALWGLENYNEPWEGGGISGWARDCLEYRALQKLIAESARKVSPDIRILAASSIMNTEDKFYSDGSNEMDNYVDVFTDHYVAPAMCYGPLVAKAHGKRSMETETWFVNSEYHMPQIMAQFMASGQERIAPWHPRVLFDHLPGNDDNYFIPTPVVAATAAFNYFVTGKAFEKLVFTDHLPWVFQFGKDDDKDALLVVFGQLVTIGGDDPKERLWPQVDSSPGGTLTIDNHDGLLQFYDLAGNPAYEGQKSVELPMTIFPSYITCKSGPAAAAARLKQARIEGKRPVEILPRDFDKPLGTPGARLSVALHNCLGRDITGKLAVTAPQDLALQVTEQNVELAAGETRLFIFPVASVSPQMSNAYPFHFNFTSGAGKADLAEVMNVAVAQKRTINVDGNLDEWQDVPGVTVVAGAQTVDKAELIRRPWLDLQNEIPDGTFMTFKLAWDDGFLYLAAQVHDKTPQPGSPRIEGRDERKYFHAAADDQIEPYKTFLMKFPGRSFAEVPYVYRWRPDQPGPDTGLPTGLYRRDRLQIALDVSDDWHDLTPDTGRVPRGFHAWPDTDYEYALYLCQDGSELWRLLAPGVPRIHDYPRQVRGPRTTGPVKDARHVVKLEGNTYTYELAIPREELANLKLAPGTTFGLMLRAGNNQGPNVDYGRDKAVTKVNGISLHPYWERSSNCSTRWTLTR